MKKITINKENWTGEEITVSIKADGSFEVYGYDFRLVFGELMLDETFRVYCDDDESPICSGFKSIDGNWIAYAGDYARTNAHPFAAAIQLLCNII